MLDRVFVLASLQATALVVCAPCAYAQCTTDWQPGSLPGVLGRVEAAVTWDPDGAGPLPPRIVMGGDFTAAGPIAANRIVAFEPASGTWSTFGSGFDDGSVSALTVMPNGELVAAGYFTAASGVTINRIARWTGSAWAPFGSGINGFVYALAVLPNGTLIAGGQFNNAGGVTVTGLASWNGSAWSAFGSALAPEYPGGTPPTVGALAVRPTGSVVVGGMFWFAGGLLAQGIAEWNGTAWSPLGTGTVGYVSSLRIAANGDVLAGGSLLGLGGLTVNGLGRWNGTTWSTLGSGPGLTVNSIHERANGEIVVGGGPGTGGGGAPRMVRRWNGTSWQDVAGTPEFGQVVRCLVPLPNGDLFVGGELQFPAGNFGFGLLGPNLNVMPLPLGFNSIVFALHRLPNGDLLAGGAFQQAPGAVAQGIARFDGTAWQAMGSGFPGVIYAIDHLPNGDPVAAGSAPGVFRWNGVSWIGLGTGINDQINDLQSMPNGDLVAAGLSGVWRWNGVGWSAMPGLNQIVWSLAVLRDGTLAAAGYFSGGVAVWNGTAWTVLGGGLPGADELTVTADGDLVAAGAIPGGPARWDGTAWTTLGANSNGVITAMAATPDGGVVVSGTFTSVGGAPAAGLARWDGASWQPLGAGLSGAVPSAWAFDVAPDGEIFVGGSFFSAGGRPAAHFARWTPSCAAGAVPYGVGCTGSGGLGTLRPRTAAWVGGQFATRAEGMPAVGVAVSVTGLAALATPLGSVLQPSLPGCTLLVTPDLLGLHVPQGGACEPELTLPNTPAIAGFSFRQQVVAIELGPTGNFVAVTATNAILLTIGVY